MIICHCQNISDHDIHAAIDWMRAADPETLITPGKIYRALGKAADCGGCVPLFVDTMRRNKKLEVPSQPPKLRIVLNSGGSHERRPKSNRVSQSVSHP
ncbi:MAG: bacterioferritin-associated ferredoxin [Paracoccaceae bacterium]